MEGLEKRDLLHLADDPFIKSILAPKGMPDHFLFDRGHLLVMCDHKVQPLRHEAEP